MSIASLSLAAGTNYVAVLLSIVISLALAHLPSVRRFSIPLAQWILVPTEAAADSFRVRAIPYVIA